MNIDESKHDSMRPLVLLYTHLNLSYFLPGHELHISRCAVYMVGVQRDRRT
jgi:hypothetical protein